MKPKPNSPRANSPAFLTPVFYFAIAILLGLSSCRKTELGEQPETFAHDGKETCTDCEYLAYAYTDSVDHPTVLGDEIKNPYLIQNMKEAYNNVNGHFPSSDFPVTHLYVKFSPRDFGELDKLEEEEVDLFDYPLNRRLITEGDYYVQPGKQLEDIPEYYAVVQSDYKFPSSIPHSIIDRMYIPDNEPVLEDEALRLTDNLEDNPDNIANTSRQPYVKERDYSADASKQAHATTATAIDCGRYPSGRVTVQDELNGNYGTRGVRQVKVVLRRLFKTEKIVTDEKGKFSSKKYFRNKYTVIVKFKNQYARISE